MGGLADGSCATLGGVEEGGGRSSDVVGSYMAMGWVGMVYQDRAVGNLGRLWWPRGKRVDGTKECTGVDGHELTGGSPVWTALGRA